MTPPNRDRVLVVEDSKSFSTVLKQLIENTHGFEVDIAASFAETQTLLDSHHDRYFAATVDYHLPDAPDGEAIANVVDAGIPAIVFTGSNQDSVKASLWQMGIADYANKRGTYNLEYVLWVIKRIYDNRTIEILIVDADPEHREGLSHLLQTHSYIVYKAASRGEAQQLLDSHPNIKMTILDAELEGDSGLQMTATIREKYSRSAMEIIGMAAYTHDSTAAQFIKSGATDFVFKPIVPEELLCRVNNAIDRHESYRALEELNRVKNQFLAIAAHDIRGPLGSIKTASDVLLKRELPAPRTSSLLNMINNNSVGLLGLLENLLDISVIESGMPNLSIEAINVSETLQERITLYQPEARAKGISITRKISKGIVGELDPIKVKQIFDNLITNAIKYSAPDSDISIKLTRDGEDIVLSVQDAGPGISAAEQDKLFQAFSVLSTKTTGGEKKTGLGLAITKSMVEAHKGKIYYRHDDICHSTFVVEMPLAPQLQTDL